MDSDPWFQEVDAFVAEPSTLAGPLAEIVAKALPVLVDMYDGIEAGWLKVLVPYFLDKPVIKTMAADPGIGRLLPHGPLPPPEGGFRAPMHAEDASLLQLATRPQFLAEQTGALDVAMTASDPRLEHLVEAISWRYESIEGNPMILIGQPEPGPVRNEGPRPEPPRRMLWRAQLATAFVDTLPLTGAKVAEYRRQGGQVLFGNDTEYLIGELSDTFERHPDRFEPVLDRAKQQFRQMVEGAVREASATKTKGLRERLLGGVFGGSAAAVPLVLPAAALPPFAVLLLAVASASAVGAWAAPQPTSHVRTPFLRTHV